WIAERAARWLALRVDAEEEARARQAIVRRAYLAVRAPDLRGGVIAPEIRGVARTWLEEARAWAQRVGAWRGGFGRRIAPLGAVHRARWLVQVVGPAAAAWSLGDRDEGELAERLVALARTTPLSAWTRDDVVGRGGDRAAWDPGDGAERAARLAREL